MMDFTLILPNEVSEKIFSYLSAEELSSNSICCRKWRKLSNSDSLWLRHCKHRNWLKFHHSVNLAQRSTTYPSNKNISGTSPSFDLKEPTDVNLDKIGKWKGVYIRSLHLHKNWNTGRYTVNIMRGHKEKVTAIDVLGDTVVSGSADKMLIFWNLTDFSCKMRIQGHSDTITQVKIKNADFVITACADNIIRIFDMEFGHLKLSLQGHNSSVDFIVLNGNLLVSAGSDRTIRVWNILKGRLNYTLRGHTDEIECIAVYKNYVLTGSWDCNLVIHNIAEGEKEQEFKGHTEVVYCCQFDDLRVVSGSADATVRIWSTLSGRCLKVLQCSGEVYCLVYNKQIIAAGTSESIIHVWSYSGDLKYNLKGNHLGVVRCLYLDNDKLISGGDQKKICIWDYKEGSLKSAVHRNPSLLHKMIVTDLHLITASPERPGTITVLTYW